MATLAELRTMLGQAKAGQNATVMVSGLTAVSVLASDLYKALPAPATQTMYVNTPGTTLNIRNAANGTTVIGSLTHGTSVSVSETSFAGTRVWAHIAQGWVAYDYLSSTPVITPSKGGLWGLHVLQDGSSGSVIPMAQRLSNEGKPLAVVTIINDIALANSLVPFVKRVVFRYVPDNGNSANPNYPSTITEQFGYEWMNTQFVHYVGLNPAVYVQPCNEAVWVKDDCQFWIGVMKYLEDKGRKGAIYADAVGNPDDKGQSAVSKWQDRIPSHRYAKANNHIVVMHLYSGENTPPGELTTETLRQYFEGRPAALYASVPADCRPVLLITEAARELSRGLFDGVENTVDWFKAFVTYMKANHPQFEGACAWTVGNLGGWESSSIDSALPQLEILFKTGYL